MAIRPAWDPPKPPPGVIEDLERALVSADREAPTAERSLAPGLRHVPDKLPSGIFPDFVETGYEIFAGLRNGDDEDRVVAKAACYAMKKVADSDTNPRTANWRAQIYDLLPSGFQPNGLYNSLVSSQVSSAATAATYAADAPPPFRQYYFRYCFSWSALAPG